MADELGGKVESYPSFDAAKKALGSRPGHEIHHIVEQCQGKPDRSGFPVERINSTDNFAFLPGGVHDIVSRKFSAVDPATGKVLRNMLNDASWDEQHKLGRKEVDRAWRRYDGR